MLGISEDGGSALKRHLYVGNIEEGVCVWEQMQALEDREKGREISSSGHSECNKELTAAAVTWPWTCT